MDHSRLLDGRLKLRHLRLVIAIEEQGSVIGAAKTLHVTQPVVTRALHEVEGILGVQLFERGPRGVTPTVYGESFTGHARAVLAQITSAGEQIEMLSRADLGTVRVGTHLAGANVLLPQAIAALKQEHPKLTVVVREATPDVLQSALLAGELDLTVGRLEPQTRPHLAQERLHIEPVRLVARRGHPVHSLRRPDLRQLAHYPWIFPVAQTALRQELEETFLAEGVPIPENRVECTSILPLRRLLVITDAIAALPLLITRQDEQLALIDTPLRSIGRSVGVTRLADRPTSPGTEALLAHLRAAAGSLPPELNSL